MLGGHARIDGETRAKDSLDHRSEVAKDAELAQSLRVADEVEAGSAN